MSDIDRIPNPCSLRNWYDGKRLRLIVFLVSFAIYALVIFVFGDALRISNNYFVVIPVITAAFAYGIWGGIAAGLLALPMNLIFFQLIGHGEYAPESLLIAECSGLIIGGTLGFLGDRFRRLEDEIRSRIRVEQVLRETLEERNLLIQEIHHRVKNNLSVIKGMISLQEMNMDEGYSKSAFRDLANRLDSLALVQDQLNEKTHFTQEISVKKYFSHLILNIEKGYANIDAVVYLNVADGIPSIDIDRISPLGILVNELVTNAFKHALPFAEAPFLGIDVSLSNTTLMIIVSDNGPGYDGTVRHEGHLGRDLIDALIRQLDGNVVFDASEGTSVTITLPITAE